MRFHILGLAHCVSTPEYSTCAFTQKVVKFCRMAIEHGHEVIHYGHKDSRVLCTEHVTCTDNRTLQRTYPGWNWRKSGFPPFKPDDLAYRTFNRQAIAMIGKRKQPGDFLLCFFGFGHKPVAEAHPDMIVIEPGIGYSGGYFAFYKAFESYALLHAYLGLKNVAEASESMWYDVVIPNYFDPDDFEYREEKGDHLAFLGRLGSGKGLHIAEQLAAATGHKLLVAGHGDTGGATGEILAKPHVEYLGVASPKLRRALLAGAKAVVCASTFVEPFCGVQVEAMLSGTPVISSDFGAFTEVNLHGITGYRCRNFSDFTDAVWDIDKITHAACRMRGQEYTLKAIWPKYEKYFNDVHDVVLERGGWYAP